MSSLGEKEQDSKLTVVRDRINPLVERRVELGDDLLFALLADEAEKDYVLL